MKTVLAALSLLSAAAVSPLVGQGDDEASRATLVGLTGVYVFVERIDDEAQRDGLDTLQVRTDVEVKLRQAGIGVLSEREWVSTAGVPSLYVNIQTVKNEQSVYAFSARIELRQGVTLIRQPSLRRLVTTWSTPGYIGTVGSQKLATLRDDVRDLTDQFINAYLAANPKR
jgi:hypothetical protein